ncbi:acetyltransferase [bacterium]|nr:acetyltransferase [bacterium]
MFEFKDLTSKDFPLLHKWLNQDHVAPYYGGKVELQSVVDNYQKKIDSNFIFPYLVNMNKRPIAFIQTYIANLVGGGWWEDQVEGTWGTDQFIGDKKYLGQGYGSAFLKDFTDKLLNRADVFRVITDPASENQRAIKSFKKAGFTEEKLIMTPDGQALLMEKLKRSIE